MRTGAVVALIAVCCLITGCGSSGSSSSTGESADGAGGGSGNSSGGYQLIGCEQAFDGVAAVAIVEFPTGTKGHGIDGRGVGQAVVEFVGAEEPETITVYAGSVEPIGPRVFGAGTPDVYGNLEAISGCRIIGAGTNGGADAKVDSKPIPFGTEPPEEVQVAYESSPGAA